MAAKAEVEIVLSSGAKAGQTLKELRQTANRLNKEINNLKPGSEAFINKTKDYQKVTARLSDVRKEVKGVNTAQKGLLSSFAQLIPFGGQIQGLTGQFANFRSGVGGVTKGFKGLRGAIIATGIGAFVVLIGSLVTWLSRTQRGLEFVEKAGAAVGAVFDVIADRAVMIIDAFGLLFSKGPAAAFDKLAEAVSGVGDEMVRETKLAWDLAEAFIALNKEATDLTLIQAQRKTQIQELIFLTRDETVAFDERREALLKATAIEQESIADSIRLQRERIRLMEIEFDRAESTEEDRAKLIAERVKLEEMVAGSLSRQRELLNRVNELDTKARNDQKARRAANFKEIEEGIKAEEALLIEKADLQAELDALEQAEFEETRDQLYEIEQLRKAGLERQKTEEQKAAEDRAKIKEQELQDDISRNEARMAAAMGTLSFISTITGGIASLSKKEGEEQRKAAILNARATTFQAALNAYASTTKIPIVGPVLAPIAAAAALIFGNIKVNQMAAVPTAAQGKLLRGKRHSTGGIPVIAEDHEIILTRGVGRDPAGLAAASELNARYGGVRFMQSGGPVSPLSPADLASAASAPTGTAAGQASDDVSKKLDAMIGLIARWPTQLQVNNNVQDTQKGINVINKLEADAAF